MKKHPVVQHRNTLLKEPGLNDRIAVWISDHVGSMYCAYVFALIGTVGIVAALTKNAFLVLLIGAVSGYFLQLVLLPIIMVAQNVAGKANDAKANVDHQTLTYLANLQDEQMTILNTLKKP